jgi:O-antigen/teichoic acid export membrane protein
MHVAFLALILTASFCALVFPASILVKGAVARWLRNPEMTGWLPFVSISVLFLGWFQTFNYWANRINRYRDMAIGKALQSAAMVAAALGLGLLGWTSGGLIVASMAGQLAAAAFLGAVVLRSGVPEFDAGNLRRQAGRYKKFPKINSLHALMDVLQLNGIVFLISALFGKTQLGYYALTMRVLRTPLSMIGTSVAQVFYHKSSEDFNAGKELVGLVRKTTVRLALLALPVFLVLFFAAPRVFSLAFGPQWREAGIYAQILAPWLYLNFIYSPISQIPLLLNRQGTNFMIGFGYNLLIVVLLISGQSAGGIKTAFAWMSVAMPVYLIGTLFWIFRISKSAVR